MKFWKFCHAASQVSRFQPTYWVSLLRLPRLNCVYTLPIHHVCVYTCRRDRSIAVSVLLSGRTATEHFLQIFKIL